MYDPRGVDLMVNALRQRAPRGPQLAGEVVPMPGIQNPSYENMTHLGPTNKSADYAWGLKQDPRIGSIGKEKMQEWLVNTGARLRAGLPYAPIGGLPPTQGPWPPGSGGNLPPRF